MDSQLRSTLVDSVLDTTGSMQRLMEELDRLGFQEGRQESQHTRRPKPKKKKKGQGHVRMYRSQELVESSWLPEVSNAVPTLVHEETLSLDDLSFDQPRTRSTCSASSHFDSAIGSLPSQMDGSLPSQMDGFLPSHTDDDSVHSLSPHNLSTFDVSTVTTTYAVPEACYELPGWRYTGSMSLMASTTHPMFSYNVPQDQKKVVKLSGSKKHRKFSQSNTTSTSSISSTSSSTKTHPIPETEGKDLQSGSSSSTVTNEWPSTGGEDTRVYDKRASRSKKAAMNSEITTPKASPPLPRRYQATPQVNSTMDSVHREARRTNAPKRSASILQRLRRRHGSFKRDRRPRKGAPVKRSFSDRIAYHKGCVYEDDDPISAPSLLRPVGRLLDVGSGNLHVVELHKPPNGRYGIYITEGLTGGVFISRFAEESAEKFFSGLLSPGDEIVAVNGQTTRNKSLDHVHNALATLDYVILTVIPVSGRPDW